MRSLSLSLALVIALNLGFCAGAQAAPGDKVKTEQQDYYAPFAERNRTINRTPSGSIFYPKWILNVPEHYEFLPLVSNHDPQHQHPAQWAGQDWDPAMWPASWTPEIAIDKFFQARIFNAQYMEKTTPVLELGPKFYKLSDLDQRRTLKLLADTSGILAQGHTMVMLRDWHTKEVVGTYSDKGMQLW